MDIIRLIDRFDSDGAVAGINELLAFNLPIEDREALHTALDRLNDYDFDGALIAMRHFQ